MTIAHLYIKMNALFLCTHTRRYHVSKPVVFKSLTKNEVGIRTKALKNIYVCLKVLIKKKYGTRLNEMKHAQMFSAAEVVFSSAEDTVNHSASFGQALVKNNSVA